MNDSISLETIFKRVVAAGFLPLLAKIKFYWRFPSFYWRFNIYIGDFHKFIGENSILLATWKFRAIFSSFRTVKKEHPTGYSFFSSI
jgi:hypothetical protein